MSLRRFKAVLLPLCAACLLLAGWMVYHSLSGAQWAGCGTGSGCHDVMGSPWAYVLGGVPVSLPAAAVYLLLGICVLFLGGESAESRSLDRMLWRLMPLLGGCIAGAALWFIWLQAGVLHAFCPYCTALHLLGCIAAAFVCVAARRQGFRPWLPFAAGLAAAALFAFVQSRTLPEAATGRTDAPLPSFAPDELPVLGPEDAPETLTLLFDFQCSHCRRLHRQLPELLDLADGQYRIVLCPVPLSSACNPYIPSSGIDRFAGSCPLTRLALAVWYACPEDWGAFWDGLLGDGTDQARITPDEAERRARELLGDGFATAMADPHIEASIRKAEELFGRTSGNGTGGVPRIILGQRWFVPETDFPEEVLALIRRIQPNP